jgi:hypothetical protein
MAESKVIVPPTERIVSSFKQLAVATNECDAATAELGETITTLETALAKLRVPGSAWHRIAGGDDRDGNYWSRDTGYTKFADEWRIAIRRTWGNEYVDDGDGEEVWRFNEAPRWMCIESAGKLPDLFDELLKRTRETTEKLKARTAQTKELAAALSAALPETVPAKKPSGKGAKS